MVDRRKAEQNGAVDGGLAFHLFKLLVCSGAVRLGAAAVCALGLVAVIAVSRSTAPKKRDPPRRPYSVGKGTPVLLWQR